MYMYIILSYTGSMPSKLIKMATKDKYTHVSISESPDLRHMYSFGRKYQRFPYPGGFIKENIKDGLYSKRSNVSIAVYRIPISRSKAIRLHSYISKFDNNAYFYDFLGALGVYIGKNTFKDKGYVCSSFAWEALKELDVEIDKESWQIKPQDFASITQAELIYEGNVLSYNQ